MIELRKFLVIVRVFEVEWDRFQLDWGVIWFEVPIHLKVDIELIWSQISRRDHKPDWWCDEVSIEKRGWGVDDWETYLIRFSDVDELIEGLSTRLKTVDTSVELLKKAD